MKKFIKRITSILVITVWCCNVGADSMAAGKTDFYAHRGGKAENDENTLQAFRQCLSAGVNRFETDIRMSEDGMLVISHDASLKRRTGFDGVVENMKGKDVISKKTFLGNNIPSLAQVLDLFKKEKPSYVEWEMKTSDINLYPDARIPEYCEAVYKAVSSAQPEGTRWVFTSFDTRPLEYIRKHFPEAKTGYITSKPVCEETIAEALRIGATQIDAGLKETTAEAVAAAHTAGLEVCLWPGTKTEHYLKMKELGADRCCTDIPNVLAVDLAGPVIRYLGDKKAYATPEGYIHDVLEDKTLGADAFIQKYYEPLRAEHPDYITRDSIGRDDSGKYIMWCYTFTPRKYKKTVYIQAGVHGRNEFESYFACALMMHLIADADNGDDPHLKFLRKNIRFVVVPLVNVSDASERLYPPKNSNKINLNRDWYDEKSQEIRNIKAMLSTFRKGEICFGFDLHTDPRGIPGWGAYLLPYADNMPAKYSNRMRALCDFLYDANFKGKIKYEGEDLYRAFIGPNSEYPKNYKEWMNHRNENYRRHATVWKSCCSGMWKTYGIPSATIEHGARKYGPEGSSTEMARAIEMTLNHILVQTK